MSARSALRASGSSGVASNLHVAARLDEAATLLREQRANPYRSQAYRRAADPIELLATVPGISRRSAGRMHDELGIHILEELEAAAHDGRLTERLISPGDYRGRLRRFSVARAILASSGSGCVSKPSLHTSSSMRWLVALISPYKVSRPRLTA